MTSSSRDRRRPARSIADWLDQTFWRTCSFGKYCEHLPLYRQSEIYARKGIELDRSTLAAWVGDASRTLEPLVDAIQKYVLTAMKIHAGDIPVPVLAPGPGKTKNGPLVDLRS